MKTYAIHPAISRLAAKQKQTTRKDLRKIFVEPGKLTVTNTFALFQTAAPIGDFKAYTITPPKKEMELKDIKNEKDSNYPKEQIENMVKNAFSAHGQRIKITIKYLRELLQAFEAYGDERVILKITGSKDPIYIHGETSLGSLMPCKFEPLYNDLLEEKHKTEPLHNDLLKEQFVSVEDLPF